MAERWRPARHVSGRRSSPLEVDRAFGNGAVLESGGGQNCPEGSCAGDPSLLRGFQQLGVPSCWDAPSRPADHRAAARVSKTPRQNCPGSNRPGGVERSLNAVPNGGIRHRVLASAYLVSRESTVPGGSPPPTRHPQIGPPRLCVRYRGAAFLETAAL